VGGQKRFSELLAALPGLAPNLLSGRLKQLTHAGIVQREYFRELPPRTEYSLTETGQALRPILFELLRWGHKHASPPPDPGVSLQRWLSTLPLIWQADEVDARSRIRISIADRDTHDWLIEVRHNTLMVKQAPTENGDALVEGDCATLSALFERRESLASAAGDGRVRVNGDTHAVERFLSLLPRL
jgi:DNA-binding HxlR family transcriptional regulator